MEIAEKLPRGRDSFSRRAWGDAYEALTAADGIAPLGPSDLGLLATSAYMLGREQEYRELLERAYHGHLEAEERLAAVRCAFWIGLTLASHGELGRAGGWLGRAERLLDREGADCVERGYLLIPRVFEHEADGELERAAATAAEAAAVGERFGDADLLSLGAFAQGSASAIQAAVPGFTGPPTDPPPLPFQLQDPETVRRVLAETGLRKIRVETTTENLEFESGADLWNWQVNSNPIAGAILAELGLTAEQTAVVRTALDGMVRERSGGSGHAVLTVPINIGFGKK